MVDNIKEIGLKIIWKIWVSILGLMVDVIWENTKMIRNMDMVFTNGLMEDSISVTGCAENNMDLEFTRPHRLTSNMDFGKKEKELNGLMRTKLLKSKMDKKTSAITSKSQRTNNHRYMDRLKSQTTLIINCKKYNRGSEL